MVSVQKWAKWSLLVLPAVLGLLVLAPRAQAELSYTLNARGLATFAYNGTSFLGFPYSGQFAPNYGTANSFRKADNTTYAGTPISTSQVLNGSTVTVTYPWGVCRCAYSQTGERLNLDIDVTNTTPDTMTAMALKPASMLVFPNKIGVFVGDPGMFYGNCGPTPLSYPHAADPDTAAPVIRLDYGSGVVDFDDEDVAIGSTSVYVPYAEDGQSGHAPNCMVAFDQPIAPGATARARVSLRFAPEGTPWTVTSGDVIDRYNARYPLQLQWNDHRPIGFDILASPETHSLGNPRGYFTNATDVDIRTDAGKVAFRAKLMARADAIIATLKAANAQGFICWDIEGAENANSTFYGDPAYVENIPEMTYKDASGVMTCDAFFHKIAAAGFKVGNCLRPQDLTLIDGALNQCDSPDPGQTLIRKVNYAAKRWGSTLFYVDSTTFQNWPRGNPYGDIKKSGGSIGADYIRTVHEACPNAILFPENQYGRYYAYSAPLDGYDAHGVKGTNPMVRDEWPGAFTILMFNGLKKPEDLPALVDGVKHGDILLVPCWYMNPGVKDALNIYARAGSLPSVQLSAPGSGTMVKVGANVTLTAAVTPGPGATIAKVEFFAGSPVTGATKIGEKDSAPYSIKWLHVPPGEFAVTAKATDSNGLTQYSAAAEVEVRAEFRRK